MISKYIAMVCYLYNVYIVNSWALHGLESRTCIVVIMIYCIKVLCSTGVCLIDNIP